MRLNQIKCVPFNGCFREAEPGQLRLALVADSVIVVYVCLHAVLSGSRTHSKLRLTLVADCVIAVYVCLHAVFRGSRSKQNGHRRFSSSAMPLTAFCCVQTWQPGGWTSHKSTGLFSMTRPMRQRSVFMISDWIVQYDPPDKTKVSVHDY